MFNDNTLFTDLSLSDDNDDYDEENEHTTEQLFNVARSGSSTYKPADYLYWYTIWDVLFVYYICLLFDDQLSDI